MRVAVHHPARTEPDGTTVPESVSAFRLGRIHDFVNHLSGETTEAAEVAKVLFGQAAKEHPDCRVVIEHLVDNGDGTSRWVPEGQVPEGATSPDGSVVAARELSATQTQEVQP